MLRSTNRAPFVRCSVFVSLESMFVVGFDWGREEHSVELAEVGNSPVCLTSPPRSCEAFTLFHILDETRIGRPLVSFWVSIYKEDSL